MNEPLTAADRRLLPSRPLGETVPADPARARNKQTGRKEASRSSKTSPDERALSQAYSRLAGLLERDAKAAEPPPVSTDPLFEACRLVAGHLGLELQRPSRPNPEVPGTVVDLCEASRIRYRQITLRGDWWRQDHGPLLGASGSGLPEGSSHPVALLPVPGKGYEAVDVAAGTRRQVDAEVAAALSPEAWLLYRPLPERPLGLKEVLRFGWQGLGGDFLTLSLASLSGALLALATPFLTERIVNVAIAHSDRSALFQILLVLLVVTVAGALFQLAYGFTQLRLKTRIDGSLQVALWSRLLSLPVRFLHRFSIGDIGARVMGLDRIRELLSSDLTASVLAVTSAFFSLAALLWYSWPLALVAVALSGVLLVALSLLFSRQLHHHRAMQSAGGRLESLTYAILSGIVKLRIGGAEQRAFASWVERFSDQRRHSVAVQRLSNIQAVMTTVYSSLCVLLIYALLALTRLELGIGEFLAFNAALVQFQAAILSTSAILPTLMGFVPTYERILPILQEVPEDTGELQHPGTLTGRVELQRVSFRYDPAGPLVLDDVSMRVEPGETVAVVGPSGSGKSTCLRLLLGFEEPVAGRVLYDGQDLQHLSAHQVRSQMGVVLQNDRPIVGNISQNVLAGRSLGLEDTWEAIRRVGLEDEVRALPMGLFTLVNQGGVSFSGGQRQRLLLARAIVHDPKILLLDEATSALDNTTQNQVIRSLAEHRMTCLIIAHRLSTIRHADRIYVLHEGKVVEEGTFDELLKLQGFFASMAKKQQLRPRGEG